MSLRALAFCGAIIGAIAAFTCETIHGQEPRSTFMRLLVPEERVAEVDIGKKLLPLKSQEFEELVGRLTRKQEGTLQPHVDLASYEATFDGKRFTEGTAVLQIVREDKTSSFLSWGKCNLAITSAIWDSKQPRAARFGGNRTGETGVIVDSKEDLKLTWQFDSDPRLENPLEFNLQLPPALVSRMTIRAPAFFRLQTTEGLVSEEKQDDGEGFRKWQIVLGAEDQLRVKFLPYAEVATLAPRVTWRESLTYDVSLSSLECQAVWGLDISQAPLPQLTLRGEKGTSLSEVRVGDRSLPWSLDATGNKWTAVVDLPEPLQGPGRQVIVRTLSPPRLTGKQKLPRVILDKANWQEGDSVVRVSASLRVEDAVITAGRPLGVALDASLDDEDQFRFQHFTRDSSPELTLGRRQNTLHIVQGTLVQIDTSQMNVVVQGEAGTTGGNRFTLEGDLPRDWVIDSVATVPPDALEDRVISLVGEQSQRLEMRLRQPASDVQRIRFEVRAHCARPTEGGSLGIRTLRALSFRDAESHKLIAVDVLDPTLQLQLTGDSLLSRQAANELTDEEASLLSSTGILLFHDDERADGLALTLERRQPRFTAGAHILATVETSRVDYQLNVRCIPDGTPPRKLLVRIATPATSEIDNWRGSESLGELTARRLPKEAAAESEDWLLEWSRTPSGPFVVSANFSRGFEAPQLLPLVTLPEATTQSGFVEVYSAYAGLFTVIDQNVEALPIVSNEAEASRMRARWHYEPTQSPRVTLVPMAKTNGLPAAHAGRVQLHSRLGFDGSAVHRVQMELVHDGEGSFHFRIPQAQLLQVLADQKELEVEARTVQGSDWHSIRLPAESQRVQLQIHYRTNAQGNRWLPWHRWKFFGPEFDIPVEHREWTVLLPPGIEALQKRIDPPLSSLPKATALTASEDWEPSGDWSQITLPWPDPMGSRLELLRPAVIHSLRLACMLMLAGLLLIFGWQRRPWILPGLLAVCGVAALTPMSWNWLAQGCAWGILAAIICDALRRPSQLRPPAVTSPPRSSIISAAVAFLCLCFPNFDTTAQEAPAAKPNSPPPWIVVTPVNKAGKPTGNLVYVEEGLYRQLTRPDGNNAGQELTWLLRSSQYRGVFRNGTEGSELGSVQGEWNLETLVEKATVQLSLNPDEYQALSVDLDGSGIVFDWDRSSNRVSFLVPQPGEHRLQIKFLPKVTKHGESHEAQFHIPASPVTRVIIDAPAESREIECFAGERRLVRPRGEPASSMTVGAAEWLKFRWSETESERRTPTVVGEQLCWWKLRPNSVTVDATIRLRPDGGKLSSFKIVTDPRLRWLPGMDSNLKVQNQLAADGTFLEWQFTLTEPTTREFATLLSFQWLGLSGIGNFYPPFLELQATRLDRRWSAVSAATNLSTLGTVVLGQGEVLAAGEFVGVWIDPTVTPPDTALRTPWGNETWSVELRPVESPPTVREQQLIGFQRDRTRVQYQAEIEAIATRRLIHRLRVPAGFVVETITIEDDEQLVPCTASAPKQNVLTILAEPGDERALRSLKVVGRLPTLTSGSLPRVAFLEGNVEESAIDLYRTTDVSLTVQATNGFTKGAQAVGTFLPTWGRHVARLNASAAGLRDQRPPGQVTTTKNQPTISGDLRLSLERSTSGWSAQGDLQFSVKQGELDELRLEVPVEWSDIKPRQSNCEIEVRKLPGQPRTHLIIRPAQPWTGTQSLSLVGPLLTSENGVRAPEVHVLDYEDWRHYVVLPTRFQNQRIRWTLSGLEGAPWPKDEVPPPNQEHYRQLGPRYSAMVQDLEYDVGEPHVLLAEAVVRVRQQDGLAGELAWELVPNGKPQCTLVVPESLRLVQVEIDGSPAIIEPLSHRKWSIHLASHDLPQRIEVAFQANDIPQAFTILELPTLEDLRVTTTTWTILGSAPAKATNQSQITGALGQAFALALEAQTAALKIAKTTELTTEFPEFAADWFLARSINRNKTLQQLEQHNPQWQSAVELSSRVGMAQQGWDDAADVFPVVALNSTMSVPPLSSLPVQRCTVFEGWMAQQSLDLRPPKTAAGYQWGIAFGILCFGLGTMGVWGLCRGWWPKFPELSLGKVLFISGLIALIGIQPIWLGIALLIAAGCWKVGQAKLPVLRRTPR